VPEERKKGVFGGGGSLEVEYKKQSPREIVANPLEEGIWRLMRDRDSDCTQEEF